MILISHRGNVDGRKPDFENHPDYIDYALDVGFDVEIDVRYDNSGLWLGHDEPQYETNMDWLYNRSEHLWIHCKDLRTLDYFADKEVNYFYHNDDYATITSDGFLWIHPSVPPLKNGIAVLPELEGWDVHGRKCIGVCSDVILNYSE